MPGEIQGAGKIAELFNSMFRYFTGADGWEADKKKRLGDKLQAGCDRAEQNWRANPTADNWQLYKEAEAKLVAFANEP